MNLTAINDDELLHETPIGRLKVVRMRNWLGVAVVDPRTGKERVIHELKRGGTVLDAVYGKRAHEAGPVQRMYAQRRAEADESRQRLLDDISKDQQKGLGRLFSRFGDDAREAVIRVFGR
jgi:hypothetical protein